MANVRKKSVSFTFYIVHYIKRLKSVTLTFPERGHSYMECDRNMTLIPKKQFAELPKDTYHIIREARVKTSPFRVIECEQNMFKDWNTFFKTKNEYAKKLAMRTRPIKELKVETDHFRTISHRSSYNGYWESSIVIATKRTLQKKKTEEEAEALSTGEFFLLSNAYDARLPLPEAKWRDLQDLIPFLTSTEAREFYRNLPHGNVIDEDE
ncbi:hypothetical protein J6590_030526 [Homalodisca vitripennis]|nr:hypothetical protein J6590_030526 [Homalodisca vitripennis]